MMPTIAAAGAAVVMTLVTCTTVSEPPTTTAPPPTTAAPGAPEVPVDSSTTTTVSPSTTPETSTPPSDTEATTTTTISPGAGAPVVTLVPLTDEEAEVVERLYEARTLAFEAVVDPDSPGLDERLDALFARQGQQRGAVEANRQYLREHGLRGRMNPDQPWQLIVESVTFIEEPFRRADVQTCVVDTSILYEPGGAPDGSDAIVNDDVGSVRVVYSLVMEDGAWQLLHGQGLTELLIGETSCPPAE